VTGTDAMLDGLRMNVTATDAAGVVGAETTLEFRQRGSIVSARYSGGDVEQGFLVGTLHGDKLEFRFVQVDRAGRIDGGHSTCDVTKLDSGKVRIHEHFQWDTRPESGTNVFDELPD